MRAASTTVVIDGAVTGGRPSTMDRSERIGIVESSGVREPREVAGYAMRALSARVGASRAVPRRPPPAIRPRRRSRQRAAGYRLRRRACLRAHRRALHPPRRQAGSAFTRERFGARIARIDEGRSRSSSDAQLMSRGRLCVVSRVVHPCNDFASHRRLKCVARQGSIHRNACGALAVADAKSSKRRSAHLPLHACATGNDVRSCALPTALGRHGMRGATDIAAITRVRRDMSVANLRRKE